MVNDGDADEQASVTRLCDAVAAGELDAVRRMLRQRPELVNMERPSYGEQRALHIAVLRRDVPMVRLLLDMDADPRIGIYPHRDATSAFALASERGYDELVAIIEHVERRRREAMSCPNATVSAAQNELNSAIRQGDDAGARAIVETDRTLVKACDDAGRTPLHVACEALNEPMVAWLLKQGADVKRRDAKDRTPLDRAADSGWKSQENVEKFAAVAAMLRQRGAALTPRSAVALGEGDWLRQRHAEGTLVDPIGPSGGLLSMAVKHDRMDMLALLLDMGLDVDERERVVGIAEPVYSWGMPLWHCAGSGQHAMAQLLLERGADPNAQVYASGDPVFQAYRFGDQRMIELLREHGSQPDAITAGLFGQVQLARQMLAGQVDGRLANGHFAGDTIGAQLLWGAACGGDVEIVRLALEHVDWPRDDRRWYTMLEQPLRSWNHCKATGQNAKGQPRSTYLDCFALILGRCDPRITGGFGRTMLHEVAAPQEMTESERVAFATMLLDARPDAAPLDVRDELLRSTPLAWGCRWGRLELVELLLSRGALAHEPTAESWAQPLAWAVKMGREQIAELLRARGA